MHKIGSIIAIFSGAFQILAGSLILGQIGDLEIPNILGAGRDTYSIFVIIFGAITALLGFGAWGKPRGVLSLILLVAFTVNVVLLVINGWTNSSSLASLIVNIAGGFSILYGLLSSKKNS